MKLSPLLLGLVLFGNNVLACTTFCINKNGQIVFGRNYDWVSGAGIVHTNQRGLFKSSMATGNEPQASWVSKYGSISFNQYGKEFPTGGMNEKGLVVELMWLDGTQYPGADTRPAVGVLQWIQYQLDNAASTAEVISSDKTIRITEKSTPIHYLVADASGHVATIEFLNGKMTVHTKETLPYPVLTNDTYNSSVQVAKPILDKKQKPAHADNSLDRFVKACSMVELYQQTSIKMPVTDYAFSILDKVSQGNFTKWSIVYDISNKKILFKTADNRLVKTIQFSAFDFACTKPAKMFNMNQDMQGDVSNKFTLPDAAVKKKVLELAITESNDRVGITDAEKNQLLHYEDGISCKL